MSQAQGQELALRQATQSAVAQLQDQEFAQQVQLAVPEGVSPRQYLRAAATAVLDNPKLAAPALRPSLLKETLKCAQDGLLPDGREAAFLIYRTKDGEKVVYMPMIGGLRKISADHGWMISTAVVYENDGFDPDMDAHKANHKPTPLGQDRGNPIGAYAIAEHRDGRREGPEIFTIDDIEKRRQVSKAKDKGPWVDWWETMAEKTVGKRLFKKLSLDQKDRRIQSVLQALAEEENATDTLYGPAPAQPQAQLDQGSSAAATDEGEPEEAVIIEADGDGDDLNEPSDEELAALGAGQVTIADEVRFDKGKFAGKTFAEVFAEGQVGIGYLKWALRDWADDSFREALGQFADQHPELRAGE